MNMTLYSTCQFLLLLLACLPTYHLSSSLLSEWKTINYGWRFSTNTASIRVKCFTLPAVCRWSSSYGVIQCLRWCLKFYFFSLGIFLENWAKVKSVFIMEELLHSEKQLSMSSAVMVLRKQTSLAFRISTVPFAISLVTSCTLQPLVTTSGYVFTHNTTNTNILFIRNIPKCSLPVFTARTGCVAMTFWIWTNSTYHLPCHITYCIYNANDQNGINEGKLATEGRNVNCLTWVLQCFDNISCTYTAPFIPHDIMSAGHPTLCVLFSVSLERQQNH